MNATYEVTLGPAAIRVVLGLRDRKELADALQSELVDGPNADKELRFDADGNAQMRPHVPSGLVYTATPLGFDGYTAFHRRMTDAELRRLSQEQDRPVAAIGFYVVDILAAESGFTRGPRLV
jgi:hypothetical protein